MNSKINNYVALLITGIFLFGSAVPVLAQDQSAGTTTTTTTTGTKLGSVAGHRKGVVKVGFNINLKDLVANNVISQATADALQTFFQKQFAANKAQAGTTGQRTDLWTSAVTAGVITQAQADAIKAYQTQAREKAQQAQKAKVQDCVTQALATMVKNSVITQAQSDKITALMQSQEAARQAEEAKLKTMTATERKAYMQAQQASRKAEMDKIKAMTAEERQAYMKSQNRGPLSSLVANGTLTQAQATAIEKAIFNHGSYKK